jgi:hypothetical protein
MSKLYPSISGLSILMALALALGEWYFFFYGGTWEGPFGFFAPSRLGFNLAWLTLVYLSFQLLSIPSPWAPDNGLSAWWMGWRL